MSGPALLELRGVNKSFGPSDTPACVLRDIDLVVERGEMLAIMGPSGSGKSTLLNLLGCLDQVTSGDYFIDGHEVPKTLGGNDVKALTTLATLRRRHIGFVFQRYHLLSHLTALENVALPSIYQACPKAERHARAAALLDRLGLAERHDFFPHALSGGQQQRVSIARALMNRADVILADEPTGALDTVNGAEVMAVFQALHRAGQTIILVTHDKEVARHATRVVEMRDGRIIADTRQGAALDALPETVQPDVVASNSGVQFSDLVSGAWEALVRKRMRSLLTMLGMIMGITSVASMLAFGEGSRTRLLDELENYSADAIYVLPGGDSADRRAGTIRSFLPGDVTALAALPMVAAVTPMVMISAEVRRGNKSLNLHLAGANERLLDIFPKTFSEGHMFSAQDVRQATPVAVINETARDGLFGRGESALNRTVYVGTMPARIIGVMQLSAEDGGVPSGRIVMPVSAVNARFVGQRHYDLFIVKLRPGRSFAQDEAALEQALLSRHGIKDFHLMSYEKYAEMQKRSGAVLSAMILAIAAVSLAIAGIGVMNVMLVSVTERTAEIGLRMATGARPNDIRWQFLTEASILCVAGGLIGVALSCLVCRVLPLIAPMLPMTLSGGSLALACASAIGMAMLFGYIPARNAARLNPVEALAHD